MGQIGLRELVLLAIVVLLVFGAKRLPDIARSLGKSARILKSETAAMRTENRTENAPAEAPAQQPAAPRTIQAAPGDMSTARPVTETGTAAQG
ncbi:Sec-independent protein translocase subunit TatA [Streptomyces sp. NPDC049881]|uniref:Sec-independent protein translocase subunit TatA n=1 Tax=unclassified Streptomyces TaxID=2593676 RepID=UPI003426E9D4